MQTVEIRQQLELFQPSYEDVLKEYFKWYRVLTLPVQMDLIPNINPIAFKSWMRRKNKILIPKGWIFRSFLGKGIILCSVRQDLEEVEDEVNREFLQDMIVRIETKSPYKTGRFNNMEYFFFKNSNYPPSLQKLCLIGKNSGEYDLVQFFNTSMNFEIIAELIQDSEHLITNSDFSNLIQCLGVDLGLYSSRAIHDWFTYCKRRYGLPMIEINGLGWGLANPEISDPNKQIDDIRHRLLSRCEIEVLNNNNILVKSISN